MIAKESIVGKRLPALHKIFKQKNMDAAGMSTVVPGWASFTIWLIDRQGIDKFMKFYKATNKVDDPIVFASHFKTIYGKEFDEADREWRLWVLRYQPRR
jgi:uncharacterized protein with PQ loop repeat